MRAAVLNTDGKIVIVYEMSHFISLGLSEDPDLNWVIDRSMSAYASGTYLDGAFFPPEPCEDCMKNHQ